MTTILCLPPELISLILSFLTDSQNRQPASPHPLNSLASTCRHLHAVIESHTRGLLRQYANFTLLRNVKGFCYRRKWLAETCQFCKRKSEKRAIFHRNLTCCRLCDKQYFPKMTMTQAIRDHHLSKLDLFTPNALHPHLPPLTTGVYTVMGGPATMILTADVLARASHIYGLLGKEMAEVGFMSRRTAHLDRLVMHMEIYLHLGSMKWVRAPALSEQALSRTMKSMQSEEGRREYVRKGLEAQWKCMGTGAGKVELGEHGNVLVSSR